MGVVVYIYNPRTGEDEFKASLDYRIYLLPHKKSWVGWGTLDYKDTCTQYLQMWSKRSGLLRLTRLLSSEARRPWV